MADVGSSTGADDIGSETPTQRQARLRREKRQKKMAEQGEDRLAKIKALQGGDAPPEELLGGPGVDDSKNGPIEHLPARPADDVVPNVDNPLVAALQQMQQEQQQQQQQEGEAGPPNDPMTRLMQQVMGGQGNANNSNSEQPQFQKLMQAFMGGDQKQEQPQEVPSAVSASAWKITHALFAVILASYLAFVCKFNGGKLARVESIYTADVEPRAGQRLFVIFTSAELVMLSSQYFLEKGKLQAGFLATLANSGALPQGLANFLHLLGRYIGVFMTLFADGMTVIFVLGCISWWRGAVV